MEHTAITDIIDKYNLGIYKICSSPVVSKQVFHYPELEMHFRQEKKFNYRQHLRRFTTTTFSACPRSLYK